MPAPGLPDPWFIERAPLDGYFNRKMGEWRALWREGWEVTVLIRDGEAYAFGYQP